MDFSSIKIISQPSGLTRISLWKSTGSPHTRGTSRLSMDIWQHRCSSVINLIDDQEGCGHIQSGISDQENNRDCNRPEDTDRRTLIHDDANCHQQDENKDITCEIGFCFVFAADSNQFDIRRHRFCFDCLQQWRLLQPNSSILILHSSSVMRFQRWKTRLLSCVRATLWRLLAFDLSLTLGNLSRLMDARLRTQETSDRQYK